jgi:signal transduction histidine kinase
MDIWSFYLPALTLNLLILGAILLFMMRFVQRVAVIPFIVIIVVEILWILSYFGEVLSSNDAVKIFFYSVRQVLISASPLVWWIFLDQHVRRDKHIHLKYAIVLFIPVVISFLLAITNSSHLLFHTELIMQVGRYEVIQPPTHILSWIGRTYHFITTLVIIAYLLRSWQNNSVRYRAQGVFIMLGLAMPTLAFITAPLLNVDIISPYLPSSLFFGTGAILIAWGLVRYGTFDLIPYARDKILQTMLAGVLIVDGANRVVDFNPAMQSIFEKADIPFAINRETKDLLKKFPTWVEVYKKDIQSYLEVQIQESVYEVETYPFELNEQVHGHISFVRDITQQKESEGQKLAFALERERSAFLQDFIESSSHDYRTPLTIIQSSMYLTQRTLANLEKNPQLNTPETLKKLQQYNENIQQASARLSKLIDDSLEMIRLESETDLTFSFKDINSLLNELYNAMMEEALQKKITFTFEKGENLPRIPMNPREISKAFRNIIENALRYAPENGKVTIKSRSHLGNLIISVEDNGIGIPEEDLDKIFKPYFKADKSRRVEDNLAGAGLGLSITKRIIEGHGGTIVVQSEEQKGTTVTICLPSKLIN